MTIFKIVDWKIVWAEKAMYIESEFEPTDPVVFNPLINKIELSIPTDVVGKRIMINWATSEDVVWFDEVLKWVLWDDEERLLAIPWVKEAINAAKESLKESDSEKEIDKEEVLISWRYLVNITSKGKKKVATIYDSTISDPNTSIEYDEERWDKWFKTIEEAQEYANTFNL